MTNVLVEGGGRVLGSFLDAGHVDAVEVFVAPILEGGDHARTAVRGRGRTLDERGAPAAATSAIDRVGDDVHDPRPTAPALAARRRLPLPNRTGVDIRATS